MNICGKNGKLRMGNCPFFRIGSYSIYPRMVVYLQIHLKTDMVRSFQALRQPEVDTPSSLTCAEIAWLGCQVTPWWMAADGGGGA